uniref:UNC80 domain-containing protein n=1 Tax=Rhabditophanes sp. KR3021 TaxID=114890 RepID=A0AC35TVB0_9BILA
MVDNGAQQRENQRIKKEKADAEACACMALCLICAAAKYLMTCSFNGSKNVKLHEASSVTFERVVVQNILHGLSPSLSNAMNSIARWQFVKSAFPHIVQCCGSILGERSPDEVGQGNLSSSLVKMLYILHWLLMESASECNEDGDDADAILGATVNPTKSSDAKDLNDLEFPQWKNYVFSVSNIQHFVYIMIPMLHHIKEAELLSHIRLESGVKLWKSLWKHQLPEILCFYAPTKPKLSPFPMITALTRKTSNTSIVAGPSGIYLGDDGFGTKDILASGGSIRRYSHTTEIKVPQPPPKPPRTNATLLEDLIAKQPSNLDRNPSVKKPPNITFAPSPVMVNSTSSSSFTSTNEEGAVSSFPAFFDVSSATYLDVAVIRCLLIQHWCEEGVIWSFHYLYNRLRDIQMDQKQHDSYARSRSNSVPGIRKKDSRVHPVGSVIDPFVTSNLPQLTWADLQKSSEMLDRRLSSRSSSRQNDLNRENKPSVKSQLSTTKSNSETLSCPKISVQDNNRPNLNLPLDTARRTSLANPMDLTKTRRLSRSSITLSKLPLYNQETNLPPKTSAIPSPSDVNSKMPFGNSKFFAEAVGSAAFITNDGRLSFQIILSTVLNIMDRYQNIKIYEIALSIADLLISITIHGKPTKLFPAITSVIAKVYMFLGCSFGCNEGMRTAHAGFLKVKAKNIISTMLQINEKCFKGCIDTEFETKPYQQQLDFVHSVTAFCCTNSGGGRYGHSSFNSLSSGRLLRNNLTEQYPPLNSNGSYKNKFNEGKAGIEGVVIDIFFASLISKLNEKSRELLLPENMSVYHDVRMFVCYVNERHGNPLRKTALSALMERFKKKSHVLSKAKEENRKVSVSVISEKDPSDYRKKSAAVSITNSVLSKSTTKNEKFKTVDEAIPTTFHQSPFNSSIKSATNTKQNPNLHNAPPKHSASLDQFNEPEQKEDSECSPSKHLNNPASTDSLGLDDNGSASFLFGSPLLHASSFSKKRQAISGQEGTKSGKLQFAISLLKGNNSSTFNSSSNIKTDLSEDDIISLASSKNGDFYGAPHSSHNFSSDNIMQIDDEGNYSSPAVTSLHSRSDFNSIAFQRAVLTSFISDRKILHLASLREGIRRFSFLLEMSNPGHVLDASLIGALLQLKSPVISRASLLLECAFFINRCNKGDWAEWIRTGTRGGMNSRGGNSGRGANNTGWFNAIGINTSGYSGSQAGGTHKSAQAVGISATGMSKKVQNMQRMAGRSFYQWGVCLATRLKAILEKEEAEEEINLDALPLSDKRNLKLKEEFEHFLDDASVNTCSMEAVPKSLQLLTCFLLLQISTYLRESFMLLPRSAKAPTTRNSGAQFTAINTSGPSVNLDKLASQRRWSILSNTFIQHGGSIHSINEPTNFQVGLGMVPTGMTERRVSYSTVDDDSSTRGSHDTIDELTSTADKKIGPTSRSRIAQGRSRFFKKSSPSRKGSNNDMTISGQIQNKPAHRREMSFKLRRPSKQISQQQSQPPSDLHSPSLLNNSTGEFFEERENAGDNFHPSLLKDTTAHSPLYQDNFDKSPERRSTQIHHTNTMSTAGGRKNSTRLTQASHANVNAANSVPLSAATIEEEEEMCRKMPWLATVIRMFNSFDFKCKHDLVCKENCYLKAYKQAHKLMEAYKIIHGPEDKSYEFDEDSFFVPVFDKASKLIESFDNYKKGIKSKARSSLTTNGNRRESAIVRNMGAGASLNGGDKIPAALKGMLADRQAEIDEAKREGSDKASSDHKKELEYEVLKDEEMVDLNCQKTQMSIFINTQVKNVAHAPLSFLLKTAVIMTADDFSGCVKTCWDLLLFNDSNVSSSASALFILCAIKVPTEVINIMTNDFNSSLVETRIEAIQKFYVLWRNRFHIWQKMEDGAQAMFKVPPPSIDFTLPSPMIGQSHAPVIDPPWMPYVKTRVEELSIKEEQHSTSQTIMTMTRTRRKQKQEMVKKAIREAEEKQSELRQKYMIRSTALIQQSAYEPSLFQHCTVAASQGSGEFEGNENESVPNPAASSQGQKAMPMSCITQPLLPSSILSSVPNIIELMSDVQISANGTSVAAIAKQVTWSCIIEEPSLFFRHFLEKLTQKDKQEYLFSLLRKVMLAYKYIPSQTAHCLLNYLFGFVMFYVRTPSDGFERILSLALSTIWLITPFVHGLYFKDLKQTLKKEQCDQALMITANVPSAKKIIVHGPEQSSGGIPSSFPIHEDTQFLSILTDSIEFFNIPTEESHLYYLIDSKTGMVHVLSTFVRDFYFFHRSFYPQLYLVKMSQVEATTKQRFSTFYQKLIEGGKVLLTHNALKHSPENVTPQRIFFLHDEFTHLLSFPRKAIESSFSMYFGEMGMELKAADTLHKLTWINLITSIFEKMENAFMFGDLHLFINVINGVMIVHCEDILILRRCLATYLTVAIHFNQLFASQDVNPVKIKGKYLFNLLKSMESLNELRDTLDVLSLLHHPKPLKAIDLCYKEDPSTFNLLTDCMASCVTVCCFAPESKRSYQMILVMQAVVSHLYEDLEKETALAGNISSAVKSEANYFTTLCVELKALVNGCDVLARGPNRGFDSVLLGTSSGIDKGRSFVMAESPMFFDPPTMAEEETVIFGTANGTNTNKLNSKEKFRQQVSSSNWDTNNNENNPEVQRELYRKPRDALLTLCALHIEKGSVRLKELSKLCNQSAEHIKLPDLLDHKCHIKLAEVALSLLKLASSDVGTMGSVGLQKYFTVILPITDWSIDVNRSVLTMLLRRLDKTIMKIGKKGSMRRRANWNALATWLTGLHQTLSVFPYIAHLHPVKTISQMCLRIVVGDNCQDETTGSGNAGGNNQNLGHLNSANYSNNPMSNSQRPLGFNTVLSPFVPNTAFSTAVLNLVFFLMQALGQFVYSIEIICSAESVGYAANERVEALLCYLLIPMFFKSAYPTKDAPSMASKDLGFCLQFMYNAISPGANKLIQPSGLLPAAIPLALVGSGANVRGGTNLGSVGTDISGRQGSVSVTEKGHSATVSTHFAVRESVLQSVSFALKVMILSFQKQMTLHWPKVIKIVKELIGKKYIGNSLLTFTDFLIQANLPISMIVLPMIETKLKQRTCNGTCGNDADIHLYNEFKKRMGMKDKISILQKSHRTILDELANELSQMKEDFQTRSFETTIRRETPTKTNTGNEMPSDSGSIASIISGIPRNTGTLKNSSSVSSRRHSSITNKSKGTSFIHKSFGSKHDAAVDNSALGGHSNSHVDAIFEDNEDETPLMVTTTRSRNSSIGALGLWRSIRTKRRSNASDNTSDFNSSVSDHTSIELMEIHKVPSKQQPFSRRPASMKSKMISSTLSSASSIGTPNTLTTGEGPSSFKQPSPVKSSTFCGTATLAPSNTSSSISSDKGIKSVQFSKKGRKNSNINSEKNVFAESDEDDTLCGITVTHHLI